MITNYKFQITPNQKLFPELPSIDIYVKKKVTGWIFTDEVYTWSCLPGYSRENMGTVDVSDHTSSGRGYWFYLLSRPLVVNDPAENPCYAILHEIPTDFTIGSTGSGYFTY